MSDNTIIANAGHFQREININELTALSSSTNEIREHVTAYTINGNEIFLLSNANLVNLSAGDGNPIEIMDLGLALQTLSIERIAKSANTLTNEPQPVPYDIEMEVARLAVKYWINH